MKKINFLFLLFIVFSFTNNAQTTQISGVLPGAEGREIRLLKTKDWLTKEPITIDKQVIKKDGSFSFTFQNEKIDLVTVMVSFYVTDLFAVPNFHHQLHGKNFVYEDRINPFINKQQLPFSFSKNDTLNRYIIEFERKLDEFEYKKGDQLRKQQVNLLDSLYKVPSNLSSDLHHFYENYIRYAIAASKINYFINKPLSLGREFLEVQYPDPEDFCYMRFFNLYFENYFPNNRSDISLRDIQSIINSGQSINYLLDYLGKDPILINEDVRELVCLKLLMDNFYNSKATISMLQKLIDETRFQDYKTVAQTINEVLVRLTTGTEAPQFSLIQGDGAILSSKDLKGKMLYIMFFKTNCTECLTEMEQMRVVYEKNKDFFEFVSVSLDDKKTDFLTFSKYYQFPWKVLYAGVDYDFIQQWQAKSFPLQALISKDYKIIEYPATNIRGGIIQKIEKMSWDENRLRRQQERSSSN